MSHDRTCSTCGRQPGEEHAGWCGIATRTQLARQGHDESPAGTRASLGLMKDVPRKTESPPPPHPEYGRLEYGGFDNLECAGELCAVYDKWAARAAQTGTRPMRSHAHEHAIHMVLTKISRIATGQWVEDNYTDAKVYAELAKQIKP